VLAWPVPEAPAPPLPRLGRPASEQRARARRTEGSELDGVRAWRRGDTMRQVLWKKAARSGELVSRDTAALGGHELALDWQASRVPGHAGDAERRLSRLAAWVLDGRPAGPGLAAGPAGPGHPAAWRAAPPAAGSARSVVMSPPGRPGLIPECAAHFARPAAKGSHRSAQHESTPVGSRRTLQAGRPWA
jgi:uncharacterized protein (DUF58 family)